jgi:hypothetical protein
MSLQASRDWPQILHFNAGDTITEAEVEKRYKIAAKKAHPDLGGSNEDMTQVNLAKHLALAWIAKEREREIARIREEAQKKAYSPSYAVMGQYASAITQQMMAQQQAAMQSEILGGLGNYVKPGQSKSSWLRDFFRSSK